MILDVATSYTSGLPWLPFRRANGLDQGQNGLPNMVRQGRPAVDNCGQVGVDRGFAGCLIVGRFFLFRYMLEYMRRLSLDATLGRFRLTLSDSQTVALNVGGSSPLTHPSGNNQDLLQ